MTFSRKYSSPAGDLLVEADDRRLIRLGFGSPRAPAGHTSVLADACDQLDAYFAGDLAEFDLPVDPAAGTPFERSVWAAVSAIPYGETATYAEIARALGRPSACRAVGRANGRNPLAVVVPCHRVVGSDGSLTGYAGGIEMKRALLLHEGVSMGSVRELGQTGLRGRLVAADR